MAIPVMNSKELNNIFANAQKETIKFEEKIQAIKNDTNKKIMIIKYKKALCQILVQCFFYFLETIYLEYL